MKTFIKLKCLHKLKLLDLKVLSYKKLIHCKTLVVKLTLAVAWVHFLNLFIFFTNLCRYLQFLFLLLLAAIEYFYINAIFAHGTKLLHTILDLCARYVFFAHGTWILQSMQCLNLFARFMWVKFSFRVPFLISVI